MELNCEDSSDTVKLNCAPDSWVLALPRTRGPSPQSLKVLSKFSAPEGILQQSPLVHCAAPAVQRKRG